MIEFLEGLLIVGVAGFFFIALCMLCGYEYGKRYNNEENKSILSNPMS